MAFVIVNNIKRYTCLSGDAKLTAGIPAGSSCFETDTSKIYIFDGSAWQEDVKAVQLTGSTLAEQKTNTDAVAGVLTFSANISTIEIYNTDTTNDGVFVVNGITIHVPKSTAYIQSVYKSTIGGTPGTTVTITGATTYIVSRYT